MSAVTVVVPALNAAATLPVQLAALAAQVGAPAFQVVVVDNGSTDGTAAVARTHAGLDIRVVGEARRGINWARNAGIAAATDGVILLCDADDQVAPGWVAAMAEAVDQRHWAAGAIDYLALNDDQTRRLWGASALRLPDHGNPHQDNTYGCNCGFDRAMWHALGGFDARLSGVGDENEFFMRAYAAGYRPRVVPDAVVGYRLRRGTKGWLAHRYRSARSQGMAARAPGGAYLRPLCRPRATLWGIARLLVAAPRYATSAERRRQWLGGLMRQAGRLRGWLRGVDAAGPGPVPPATAGTRAPRC